LAGRTLEVEVRAVKGTAVGVDDFVDAAAAAMRSRKVTAAPVVDGDGRLLGLITASHLNLAWVEAKMRPARASLAPIWRAQLFNCRRCDGQPVGVVAAGCEHLSGRRDVR